MTYRRNEKPACEVFESISFDQAGPNYEQAEHDARQDAKRDAAFVQFALWLAILAAIFAAAWGLR